MNYTAESDGTIRVLSFQSKDVVKEIMYQGKYLASDLLKRKSGDYSEDIEQLEGNHPIWGFVVPIAETTFPSDNLNYLTEFVSEMFLGSKRLSDFVCLELFIPQHLVKRGITDNSYGSSAVFPYIDKEFLHRTYTIGFMFSNQDSGLTRDTISIKLTKQYYDFKRATLRNGFYTVKHTNSKY